MSEVFLIEHTPDPEKLIAKAAKLCYSPSPIENVIEQIDCEDTEKFIKKLFELNHLSPFEHANFTFGVKCSRACSHQWVRSRIASHSQKSMRYVKENQFDFYIPPSIKNSIFRMEYCHLMRQIQDLYNVMENIPNEDRRFILPIACQTQIITTMNARELIHFFSVRCCNRAQWEIRGIARKMLYLVRQIAPNIFNNAGPNCLTRKCPEGKMSCGKFTEVREIFKNDDALFFEIQKIKENELKFD